MRECLYACLYVCMYRLLDICLGIPPYLLSTGAVICLNRGSLSTVHWSFVCLFAIVVEWTLAAPQLKRSFVSKMASGCTISWSSFIVEWPFALKRSSHSSLSASHLSLHRVIVQCQLVICLTQISHLSWSTGHLSLRRVTFQCQLVICPSHLSPFAC